MVKTEKRKLPSKVEERVALADHSQCSLSPRVTVVAVPLTLSIYKGTELVPEPGVGQTEQRKLHSEIASEEAFFK